MPDTPRTVGELLETWRDCLTGVAHKDRDLFGGLHVAARGVLGQVGILDALVGAQGRVVYTEESLLAAGHAYEDAHKAALDTNNYEAGLIAGARAAITAAGGVVADRVGCVSKEGSLGCRDREGRHDVLPLLKGDKLYIVRAKEE